MYYYITLTNSSWLSFLTENQKDENVLVPCAFGILFLMLALVCVIFVGTSQLIPHEPYTDPSILASTVSGAALGVLFFSLIGGYLTSYGFQHIMRDSRETERTTQE